MTRREWLTKVLGAAVAAAVAPLVDLTDTTPAFWNQSAIMERRPWRIIFPDGTTFHFDAMVVAEKYIGESLLELTLKPCAGVKVSQDISYPINYEVNRLSSENREPIALPSPHAPATVLQRQNGTFVDITEIEAPAITRDEFEGLDGQMIPGLQRIGSFTLTLNWSPEKESK